MAVLTNDYQMIGEKYLGNSYGNLYVRIYAKYLEQDINNNRSKVQYEARAYFSGSDYIYDASSSGNVNGTGASQVNFTKSSRYNSGETPLGSTQGWVTHDNDGKATITGSAYLTFPNWGWSGTASGSADLPTIPRNCSITATSVYIEETSQLTITNYKPDEYTFSIAYSFGNLSGYILANGTTTSTETKLTSSGITTSIGFPIPYAWYAQIPNSQFGICTLTVKTYNGNVQIGSDYQTTFYARVKPYALGGLPTATATVRDANDATYALTGNRNILIKGHSTAEVTWAATPTPEATIRYVWINERLATSSPYSFTLNDDTISVIVSDSRQMTNSNHPVSPTFTLKSYFDPTLIITSIERVNPTDNFATVKFNGTWFNQNFGSQNNTLTISWKYRETGTSNWINGGTLTNNTHYKIGGNNFWSGTGSSASEITIGGNLLLYEKNWDILIQATDKLTTYQTIGTIAKGIPIINWEEDFFNVNGDIKQNNISIFDKLSYSTSEIVVGTWINNKPIYRKYLGEIGNLSQQASKRFDISGLNIDMLTKIDGLIKYGNNEYIGPLQRVIYYYEISTNELVIYNSGTLDVRDGFVFIEYTKTTD